MEPNADKPMIDVLLEGDAFTQQDAEAAWSRLEPEFSVSGGLVAYMPSAGEVPPDVAVELIYSTFPLAEIYINLLSATIYDLLKRFVRNTGEPVTNAVLELSVFDDDGNEVATFTGRTTDPDIAERWLREVNDKHRGF
jgi:hypothetical protein